MITLAEGLILTLQECRGGTVQITLVNGKNTSGFNVQRTHKEDASTFIARLAHETVIRAGRMNGKIALDVSQVATAIRASNQVT